MKRLIATTALALSMLAGTAAEAAHFYPGHVYPGFRPIVAHRMMVGPRHVWMRGDRFMPAYGRPFIVDNWGYYHLRRPPFGYHWVRDGNRFLMVALATGVIADIAFANAYGY